MNFLDVIVESDGVRMMWQYKYLFFYCRVDGIYSVKYVFECLYQFFFVNVIFSFRDVECFIWNRIVNISGNFGKNIVLDLDVEYSNNFKKQCFKNFGLNLLENVVVRICKVEYSIRIVIENIDCSIC